MEEGEKKMKRIASLFLFTILILYFQPVIASEVVAESKITEVTVYPNFVMLNRTANLKLSTGEYQVVFSGIIPELDENSLKVSCQGSAQVKLFGAKLKKDFIKEEPSARVEQLKKEIEKLQDEIKQINNAKAILSEEKNYLDSIRLFSRDQIPKD
jgi:hypothetical protein